MNQRRHFAFALPLVLLVLIAGLLLAQESAAPNQAPATQPPPVAAPEKIFVVNGREMPGSVMQMGGRYFVNIETLAQITNGTLSIDPNRISLAIPTAPGPGAPAVAAPDGLTRAFAREAVSALADMREWKAAMATVVSFGVPVVGTWPNDYANHVQDDLTRTKLATVSDADSNALNLLQSEASNLATWSNDVVSSRAALNAARSVDPNALQNDALYRKIDACSQFLNGMIGGGMFADDARCH